MSSVYHISRFFAPVGCLAPRPHYRVFSRVSRAVVSYFTDRGVKEKDHVDTSEEDREYEEMLKAYGDEEDNSIPELYFRNPDPYLKPEPLPDDHYRPEIHFDEEGRIVVKNLDAYWLPEMKLVEEIGGTIYTVTGSYEGTELLSRKLSRIMLHNLEESE